MFALFKCCVISKYNNLSRVLSFSYHEFTGVVSFCVLRYNLKHSVLKQFYFSSNSFPFLGSASIPRKTQILKILKFSRLFSPHLILLPRHFLWSLRPSCAQLVDIIAVSTATWINRKWLLCQQIKKQEPLITGDWNFIAFLNWHRWPVNPSLHLQEQVADI